jgi:hypothetical protein
MAVLYQAAIARGHGVVAEACDRVMHAVEDRASYAGSTARRASMRKGFSRGISGGKFDADTEDLLARSGRSKATLAQEALEESFGAPKPTSKPAAPKPSPKQPRGGGSTPSLTRKRSKRW